jgi:hypothetical protein
MTGEKSNNNVPAAYRSKDGRFLTPEQIQLRRTLALTPALGKSEGEPIATE